MSWRESWRLSGTRPATERSGVLSRAGVVQVRWTAPSGWPEAWPDDWPEAWLDDVELGRLAGLARPEDRLRFVVSRHLVKVLVGELSGVPAGAVRLGYRCWRCGAPHGRPVVEWPAAAAVWWVSIAHAGDRVVVAASSAGPVGVDVEPVAAVEFSGFDGVALTEGERELVAALDSGLRPSARAELWVRKEAMLKASGEGLRVDPCSVEPAQWVGQLRELAIGPGFAGAVAVATAEPLELSVATVPVSR